MPAKMKEFLCNECGFEWVAVEIDICQKCGSGKIEEVYAEDEVKKCQE